MCSSQVLLMVEVNDEESSYAIPGKLFDYLNSKRPIISIGPTDSEVAEILNNTASGKFFNYHEAHSLKSHIKKLYDRFKNGSNNSSTNQSIEKYNRKNLTRGLSEIIGLVTRKS